MNKKEAFADAKKIFPGLSPSRISGFAPTSDGKGVIITGHEQPTSLVAYSKADLWRLMRMCQSALKECEKHAGRVVALDSYFKLTSPSGNSSGKSGKPVQLYVEVKPEECEEHGTYWFKVNGEWVEASFYHGGDHPDYFEYDLGTSRGAGLFTVGASDVGVILRAKVPSPAEVFK